jgi:hypothetical protein
MTLGGWLPSDLGRTLAALPGPQVSWQNCCAAAFHARNLMHRIELRLKARSCGWRVPGPTLLARSGTVIVTPRRVLIADAARPNWYFRRLFALARALPALPRGTSGPNIRRLRTCGIITTLGYDSANTPEERLRDREPGFVTSHQQPFRQYRHRAAIC